MAEGKCPFHRHTAAGAQSNASWWPDQLNLKMLHQNSSLSDPMGEDFNYAEEFKTIDLLVPVGPDGRGFQLRGRVQDD